MTDIWNTFQNIYYKGENVGGGGGSNTLNVGVFHQC